jgi:HAD superfamily hydrolase (TIGR01490 family)
VRLTIFDLDNTLLAGDSDHLWGQFLADRGLVDGDHYRRENDRFFAQYEAGTLDIRAFLRFSLRVLARHDRGELERLRAAFMEERIAPRIAPGAPALLHRHRQSGDHLMILTATNRFVTEPVAELLGVDTLLATEVERRQGQFTGEPTGTPCFREGKIERLRQWQAEHGCAPSETTFYSDSHNDLPLLERVDRPVAVDPDDALERTARARGWSMMSLRSEPS